MAQEHFDDVFRHLRAILKPYEPAMEVISDTATDFGLQTHWRRHKDGYPGYFAGVRVGKRYVSYHLMPLYAFPDLLNDLSPELRMRMQGKSCFNFTRSDDGLFEELDALTRRGYEMFEANGLLENSHG